MSGIGYDELAAGHREPDDLAAILAEFGVPPEIATGGLVAELEARQYLFAIRFSADRLREIAHALGNSPAGMSLRIALAGRGGRSFREIAAEIGTDAGSLHRGVGRVRRRLDQLCKTGQRFGHR